MYGTLKVWSKRTVDQWLKQRAFRRCRHEDGLVDDIIRSVGSKAKLKIVGSPTNIHNLFKFDSRDRGNPPSESIQIMSAVEEFELGASNDDPKIYHKMESQRLNIEKHVSNFT